MNDTMFPIHETSDLELAFGGDIDKLMPAYEDIPKIFKHGNTWGNRMFSDWFYRGLSSMDLKPRAGVDTNKAMRHLKAVIVSFAPKHEHKEAGIAYLLDQWFESGEWQRAK